MFTPDQWTYHACAYIGLAVVVGWWLWVMVLAIKALGRYIRQPMYTTTVYDYGRGGWQTPEQQARTRTVRSRVPGVPPKAPTLTTSPKGTVPEPPPPPSSYGNVAEQYRNHDHVDPEPVDDDDADEWAAAKAHAQSVGGCRYPHCPCSRPCGPAALARAGAPLAD